MSGSIIKVSYEGDFRRFRLAPEAGLEELRAKIVSLYPAPLGPGAEWRLLYTDEDGDRITIAQDADLALACETAGGPVLRLQIRLEAPVGSVRHSCHGHTLSLSNSAIPWICDGGDRPGGCRNGEHHGDLRYRCTQGCDFDLCQACIDDPTPGIRPSAAPHGPGPFRSGNFHNLIRNLRDTLGEHGIECSVDLGSSPPFNGGGGGGCPARGMGRGRGRRGRRGGCPRMAEAHPAATSPQSTPATTAPTASAEESAQPPTPAPTAPPTPAHAPSPAANPDVPSPAPTTGPWAAEVQLLQDMGLCTDPAAMRASLDRHKGAIGAVISELLNGN